PPPVPEQRRPVFNVIVDSNPMREIQITVENQQTIAPNRNLKPRDIANVLGVEVTNAIVGRAMQAVTEFVAGLPYPNRAVAIVQATAAAANHGINDRDFVELLVNNFFGGEPTWITLDTWRNNIIQENRRRAGLVPPWPPLPFPFALTRPTGYLVNYSDHPIVDNQFTIFTVEIPAGRYRFTAPETAAIRTAPAGNQTTENQGSQAQFDHWDIVRDTVGGEIENIRSERDPERVIRSRRTGVTTNWNRVLEIDIGRQVNRNNQQTPETVRIIAYYKASVTFNKFRPGMGGAYQGGTSGGAYNTGNRARRDSAYQAFGARAFQRGGIDRKREAEKAKVGKGVETGYRNSATRAAVNKGKRILNQYARAEYTRIFANTRREYEDRADRLREMRAEARAARRQLRAGLRAQMGMFKGRFFGGQTDTDLTNRATDTLQVGGAIGGGITAAQLQDARDALERFNKAYDEYFRDFKDAISSGAAQMESHMLERASTVTIQLARRFRMPLNGEDENEIGAKLREYALEITERFVSRGRTGMFALTRGLENLSRGLQTGSEMGYGLLENTFNFIFGPWTIMTVLALVFFFFVLTYVGYNLTYLWIFPLIGAGFTFLLNFSESFRPLDWVTHLSSGAIIGYSSILLLISLGALNWSFMSSILLWIIWAVLGFLGIFQFYQTGGWKVVLQGGVVILIFSFVALGPYSAYYNQA
ncbi:MAG: hypothetical protein HY517_04755, partial [Candidatus Aenigmarchaeota archaeon]|nr:hypothetical protein [Candidatus Aenigmarchaeota archaeon]